MPPMGPSATLDLPYSISDILSSGLAEMLHIRRSREVLSQPLPLGHSETSKITESAVCFLAITSRKSGSLSIVKFEKLSSRHGSHLAGTTHLAGCHLAFGAPGSSHLHGTDCICLPQHAPGYLWSKTREGGLCSLRGTVTKLYRVKQEMCERHSQDIYIYSHTWKLLFVGWIMLDKHSIYCNT